MSASYQDSIDKQRQLIRSSERELKNLDKGNKLRQQSANLTGPGNSVARIQVDAELARQERLEESRSRINELLDKQETFTNEQKENVKTLVGLEEKRLATLQATADEEERIAVQRAQLTTARGFEDQLRDTQRAAQNLFRQADDLRRAGVDLVRQELDYNRQIAQVRISLEDEVARKRAEAQRAALDNARTLADIESARLGIGFSERSLNATSDLERTAIRAEQTLVTNRISREAELARTKIEVELRIDELRRSQRQAELQLAEQLIGLERDRDAIVRARLGLERQVEDFKRSTSDFQLRRARAVQDLLLDAGNGLRAAMIAGSEALKEAATELKQVYEKVFAPEPAGGPGFLAGTSQAELDKVINGTTFGPSGDEVVPKSQRADSSPLIGKRVGYDNSQSAQQARKLQQIIAPYGVSLPGATPLDVTPYKEINKAKEETSQLNQELIKQEENRERLAEILSTLQSEADLVAYREALQGPLRAADTARELETLRSVANLSGVITQEGQAQADLQAKQLTQLIQQEAIAETILADLKEKPDLAVTAFSALEKRFEDLRKVFNLEREILQVEQAVARRASLVGAANNIRSFGAGISAGYRPGSSAAQVFGQALAESGPEFAKVSADAQQAIDRLEQALSDAQQLGGSISEGIRNGLTASVLNGDINQAFQAMFATIGANFLEIAARPVEEYLTRQAFGLLRPDVSGTLQATEAAAAQQLLAAGISLQAAAVQLTAATGASSIAKGFVSNVLSGKNPFATSVAPFSSLLNLGVGLGIPARASGGALSGLGLVGEQGEELFVPGMPGRVVPNDYSATRSALEAFQADSTADAMGEEAAGGAPGAQGRPGAPGAMARGTREAVNVLRSMVERTRERERIQMEEKMAGAAMQPIDVRVRALDPAGAGLATVEQVRLASQAAAREAQGQVMARLRNNPAVRRSIGL